jgi:hypothetical protein
MSRVQYRAHWEDLHKTEDERIHYGERSNAARVGLKLLLHEPGVDVLMMDGDDWRYLVSLCDPYVLPLLLAAEASVPVEDLPAAGKQAALARKEDAAGPVSETVLDGIPIMVMGVEHRRWARLTQPEREAAITLGWQNEQAWDCETMPRVTEKLWAELHGTERVAAEQLGFTGPVWDGEEDVASQVGNPAVEAFWARSAGAPPRLAASVVHPQWRGSDRSHPWTVILWSDGRFYKHDPRARKAGRGATADFSGRWSRMGPESLRAGELCSLTLHWDGWPAEAWVTYDNGVSYLGVDSKPARLGAAPDYIMYDLRPCDGQNVPPNLLTGQLGGEGAGSTAGRPGDWNCAQCNVSNFASRQACFKCNAPKPAPQLAASTTAVAVSEELPNPDSLFEADLRLNHELAYTYFSNFLNTLRAESPPPLQQDEDAATSQ